MQIGVKKMYCPKCGFQNEDNVMYCQNCGNPLRQQSGGQNRNAMNAGRGGAAEALRGLILSPVFLVAVIALTAQIAISIIAAATGYSPYARLIYSALNVAGLPDYYLDSAYNVAGMLTRTSVVSTIITNLPVIVIAVGLWLLYSSARSPMRRMETTGITMIHVVTIIRMICTGLVLAAGLISIIVSLAAVSRFTDVNPGIGIVLSLIIFGGIGFVIFFYYTKILRMINSARDIIVTGRKTFPASMFVIVLTFIFGGFQCISVLGSFVGGALAFLSQAAAATATIAFGLLMLRFNNLELQAQSVRAPMNRVQGMPGAGNMQQNANVNGIPNRGPGNSSGIPSYIPPKPETIVMGYNEDSEKKMKYANEGTVVLNEGPDIPPAKIIRSSDGMESRITKANFTMGKAYGNVDLFIEGNPAISRKHAEIIYNDGHFYIMDTKSTNHVYVDGKVIPPETPVPIRDGVKIRLADEVFVFKEDSGL